MIMHFNCAGHVYYLSIKSWNPALTPNTRQRSGHKDSSLTAGLCLDMVSMGVSVSGVSPRVHVLQGLQSGLHQIQWLEQQSGAGATERAAHEGLQGRMSLREQTKKDRIWENKDWRRGQRLKLEKGMNGWIQNVGWQQRRRQIIVRWIERSDF